MTKDELEQVEAIRKKRLAAGLTEFPRPFEGDLPEMLALRARVEGNSRSCPCECCYQPEALGPWFE